jgi:hypothetical protein
MKIKIRIRIRIRILILWIFFLLPCISYAEVVVIANLALPVTSLTREEIYRIYLGKSKFLLSGARVIPVDQRPGSS